MKRFYLTLFAVVILAALTVAPVMAAEGGHIYGIVYIDNNPQDFVWNRESGVANVRVVFQSGRTSIPLFSAWTDNRRSALSGPTGVMPPDLRCTHLRDINFGDSVDHKSIPQGCSGTFGLRPLDTTQWWRVWIDESTIPAGCAYIGAQGTAAAPYVVQPLPIGSKAGWLVFPLKCEGAGVTVSTVGNEVFKANAVLQGPYVADPF